MLQLLRGTTLWFGHFRWCNCCKPLQNHPGVLRATGSRVLLLDETGSRLLGDSVERLCSRQSLCTSSPSHLPLGEDEGVKSWAERRRMFFHSSQTGWKKKRKNRERNGSRTITGTFYKPPESFLKHLSQNRQRKQSGIMGVKQPSWLRRGHVSKFPSRSPTLSERYSDRWPNKSQQYLEETCGLSGFLRDNTNTQLSNIQKEGPVVLRHLMQNYIFCLWAEASGSLRRTLCS